MTMKSFLIKCSLYWKILFVASTLSNPNSLNMKLTTKNRLPIPALMAVHLLFIYDPQTLFSWSTSIFKFTSFLILFINNDPYSTKNWQPYPQRASHRLFISSFIYKKGMRYFQRYPNNLINMYLRKLLRYPHY